MMESRLTWYAGFAVVLSFVFFWLLIQQAHIFWFFALVFVLLGIALHDLFQTKHTLLRTFPVLGHIRYILEFFRPEIRQYFLEDDKSERPFDRETRSLIYRRAKGVNDTIAFGTDRDMYMSGYEWVSHSLTPKIVDLNEACVKIGGADCQHPYTASRLNISAMSYGALSPTALKALNLAAKKGAFFHNTGEGGLSDYHLMGGDVCLQIGTAYFGVRNPDTGLFCPKRFAEKALMPQIVMIEVKLSQGAKPAHGGLLPAGKITPEIARLRGVKMGEDVHSPAHHQMFDDPKGLCHFIRQLRELSGGKPVGFKLCIGMRSQFLALCKAMVAEQIFPDFITVDGGEGGTGAAPAAFANHIGMPLDDALAFVHHSLVGFGIREQIRIIASGQIATGFDMVRKLALGADLCNSARAMMMAVGCIQSKQCNKNTCPVGVATTNPRLYKWLDVSEKAERAYNFHSETLNNFLSIVGAMGLDSPSDISPSLIHRRLAPQHIATYEDIYPSIPEGCLLQEDTVPVEWSLFWKRASAETFSMIS